MKNRIFFSCILFIFYSVSLYAEAKHPADISYLVADFKYSKKNGVKICELQPDSLSTLLSDRYISNEDDTTSQKITEFFTHFLVKKKWAVGILEPPLKKSLEAKGWDVKHSLNTLLKDRTFLKYAALHPADPSSINSYAGIVYGDFTLVRNVSAYQKAYPGILFINKATFAYWQDRYPMNVLFAHSDKLKQYKADWRLYQKKYDSLLSARIQKDMPSEFYVIKPRTQTLANGVIVVANHDLDTVLKIILNASPSLEKNSERGYSHWAKNKDDTFLVEKFYKSDYLRVQHPLTEKNPKGYGYHYDATMRVAFILENDKGKMTYHFLKGFWKLPSKALEETGTLNQKRISYDEPPFYRAVDPKLLKDVNAQMESAMLLFYNKMLNAHPVILNALSS